MADATGTSPIVDPAKPLPRPRLTSLDALRGFDMFWIIGGEAIIHALNSFGSFGIFAPLAHQLNHKDWAGFAFYDLIFPLFVFITGTSLVFSLGRTIREQGRQAALKRLCWRAFLLYLIGIFYYGGFANEWPQMRLVGVLQRIAVAYFFAGLIFCFFDWKGIMATIAAILLGYWALMALVPVRDIQLTRENVQKLSQASGTTNVYELYYQTEKQRTGVFEPGLNVADHFDFRHLPGRKHDGHYDPEGILSTIPAVATCLIGVLAGLLLISSRTDRQKVAWLVYAGVTLLLAGFAWATVFPVIKKIWTSSYVLVAGGYSALLLAFFYLVIELWNYRAWCKPFVWIGTNAITIYLATELISFHEIAARFAGGNVARLLDTHLLEGAGPFLISVVELSLAILFCRFLYRRQIFIRL
ncbi:MAG: DUF5009 domain-containing protein [Verrucomicrobiota bacterium]|nr:DUF5009 domain-containing protein [Verrucomicrobiota bacterium]